MNLFNFIRRRFLSVQVPKVIPEDTILVLTINGETNRICGWQTPDSARKREVWYKRGTRFVLLTQEAIDQFIPPHSKDVDELTREQREYRESRLDYLREELRGERISYEELHELQSLAEYIDKDDVELLEAAGVPEFPQTA